jgi:hypothetical protein
VTEGASVLTTYAKPRGWLELRFPPSDFWTPPGVTFASGHIGCITDEPVQVAKISLLPTGRPCDIVIRDHGKFPREVTDCRSPAQVDRYRVLSHGALYKDPLPVKKEPDATEACSEVHDLPDSVGDTDDAGDSAAE